MNGVQCYEIFGGIALKNHAFLYAYKYIMCFHPHMRLDLLTSAAQTKVEFELYLGQSLVDHICISNFSMNIYYYSELWPIKFN